MYSKQKKSIDSFLILQRDINQLGAFHYVKQKKKKIKEEKTMVDNENSKTLQYQYENRLPSLYEKGSTINMKKKLNSLHNEHHSTLVERIKEFENRIYSLQTENILQKKQNERLIEHVAVLKHQKIIANQNKRSRQPRIIQQPIYQPIPQTIPQPFPFPTMMPMPQMMGYPGMNPYQMPQMGAQMGSMPYYQSQGKKRGKKASSSSLSRFRIAGLVVFFSLFFPKYAKSFTLNRFGRFKQQWGNQRSIIQAQENLRKYFRDNVTLDVFEQEDINELDSLEYLQEKSQKKPTLKKQKKKTKNKKDQSQSESGDSSDVQSSQQESKVSKKIESNTNQNQTDSNIFQFYLKIDIAVSFVVQFIRKICICISKDQFELKNPFLSLFLARQFQADRLHDEADFKYLNLHKEKGYSQNQKIVTQYLMIKNIFMYVFIEKALLSEFAKRHYIDNKKNQKKGTENKVFFSFFIRTSIFKIMVDQYLKNKISECKEFQLPKEELCPFSKQFGLENPLKNQISFQNNGIDMKQENVNEISEEEVSKKEGELKNCLDQCCKTLMKKYLAFVKKNEYAIIKQKTLKEKYRNESPMYFYLHTREEIANQQSRKAKLIKSTKSTLLSSSKYSSVESDKISIVKRLPKYQKTIKEIKK